MTFAAFTKSKPEKPMKAPDRIYNWLDSQFSVARFYGGCTYQGHGYLIDMKGEGQPLVKQSILIAELKAAKAAEKAAKAANIAEIPQEKGLF